MAQYALVSGAPVPANGPHRRGNCCTEACSGEMIAKPGNGKVAPHWAHKANSDLSHHGTGEMGEWHKQVQRLFELAGAQTEVPMPSFDGSKIHEADVVCADGRIVEAQTRILSETDIASREVTYGTMCWLYDAQDSHNWFILDNPKDPARFVWGDPDKRFLTHARPIFFDAPDGVWQLQWMAIRYIKGNGGRSQYEGLRRKVATDLLDFVTKVTAGMPFGEPPRMPVAGHANKKRGVKIHTLTPVDEWLARNECKNITVLPISMPATRPPATETNWTALAGLTCHCPTGCTDKVWGDASICDPDCHPCKIMAGTVYTSPRQKAAS